MKSNKMMRQFYVDMFIVVASFLNMAIMAKQSILLLSSNLDDAMVWFLCAAFFAFAGSHYLKLVTFNYKSALNKSKLTIKLCDEEHLPLLIKRLRWKNEITLQTIKTLLDVRDNEVIKAIEVDDKYISVRIDDKQNTRI